MIVQRLYSCFKLFIDLFRVTFQILYGVWHISALPKPLVSIFGGARIGQDTIHFIHAHQIAKQLVERDISVVTGGGPGIMQAANCGAVAKTMGTGRSIGIGVTNLGEGKNPCVHEYFEVAHFFARKWLLTQYSKAFVVFPGGFGTLDELFEVLTLMQTKQMKKVPIILVDKAYWEPLLMWIEHKALVYGSISKEDIGLFFVTDDLDEVVCMIEANCPTKKQ